MGSCKKQSRSKRKCLGRVDPETGEIIPTSGKKGKAAKNDIGKSENSENAQEAAADAEEKLRKLEKEHEELKQQNGLLLEENRKLREVIFRIADEIAGMK